jgi:aryl-alcohol dehydrogenase-like predicted oxidoreductase
MDRRRLGQSGIEIAPIMLGTNVLGWIVDQPMASRILDTFVDAGFNAVDTANTYSRWVSGHQGGESETVIGNWVKQSGKRNKAVIATKLGQDMGYGKSLKKDDVMREAEASLKRLQIERIDLLQTHFDDDVTPPEETMAAFATLIEQGKVRAIGASNVSPARLKASLEASKKLGGPRYESLQPLYNLYDRAKFETEYEALCVAEKLGVISYYSLASGFLSGKYRSAADADQNKARGGRVKGYLDARGFEILRALDQVAAAHDATQAQVSLAWLMARKAVTAPIVSATNLGQLHDILKAVDLTLTGDDIKALDQASAGLEMKFKL